MKKILLSSTLFTAQTNYSKLDRSRSQTPVRSKVKSPTTPITNHTPNHNHIPVTPHIGRFQKGLRNFKYGVTKFNNTSVNCGVTPVIKQK